MQSSLPKKDIPTACSALGAGGGGGGGWNFYSTKILGNIRKVSKPHRMITQHPVP